MLTLSKPLIIFEMANNHMGQVEHGKNIILALKEKVKDYPFDFAIKFQYRDLDTFIHPDYKERMDLKFVKRFSETRLSEEQFLELKKACEDAGFKTICTPFDEISVDMIEKHKYDYIKIASCSIRDWPLLEKISEASLPIIASTGGAEIEDVDKVVSFFKHKEKDFALMHCIGIYPTEDADQSMNRINWFHDRYRDVPVGFSTHEAPDNMVPAVVAVAKKAQIFERHVGLETDEIKLNAYSASPDQIGEWLASIKMAFDMCGVEDIKDYKVNPKEVESLSGLKRGAFARRQIANKEQFTQQDVFFAMPNSGEQLTAEGFSKHAVVMQMDKDVEKNGSIMDYSIVKVDIRAKISHILHTMQSQLNQARIVVNPDSYVELSHPYGIENFDKTGVVMVTCVNNKEYAKKLIIQMPGQFQPEHMHKSKQETFQVLWGSVFIKLRDEKKVYNPGDILTVERDIPHSFWTEEGVIIEEVSTTHYTDDSYYTDEDITKNKSRKTNLKDWWMNL